MSTLGSHDRVILYTVAQPQVEFVLVQHVLYERGLEGADELLAVGVRRAQVAAACCACYLVFGPRHPSRLPPEHEHTLARSNRVPWLSTSGGFHGSRTPLRVFDVSWITCARASSTRAEASTTSMRTSDSSPHRHGGVLHPLISRPAEREQRGEDGEGSLLRCRAALSGRQLFQVGNPICDLSLISHSDCIELKCVSDLAPEAAFSLTARDNSRTRPVSCRIWYPACGGDAGRAVMPLIAIATLRKQARRHRVVPRATE